MPYPLHYFGRPVEKEKYRMYSENEGRGYNALRKCILETKERITWYGKKHSNVLKH